MPSPSARNIQKAKERSEANSARSSCKANQETAEG